MDGRKRWIVFGAALGLLVALPMGAGAQSLFDDVPDSSVHFDGIEFMKNSGVTVGCGGNDFCPRETVFRDQMGTFMYRLSGNDPATAPSVNATSIDGIDSTGLSGAVNLGLNFGETATIVSDGTLSMTAQCVQNFGGNDAVDFFWRSNVAGTRTSLATVLPANATQSIFGGPQPVSATGVPAYGLLLVANSLIGPTGETITFIGSFWGANVGGTGCVVQGLAINSPAT